MSTNDEIRKALQRAKDYILDAGDDRTMAPEVESLDNALANLAPHPAQQGEAAMWKDCADYAWTILANAGSGDWSKESPEWQKAVVNWRYNSYYKALDAARSHSKQEGGA